MSTNQWDIPAETAWESQKTFPERLPEIIQHGLEGFIEGQPVENEP